MSTARIQIGQLWKKDDSGEIYIVTRVYAEALNTMVVFRKSGSEGEASIRVKAVRKGAKHAIPGFTPAIED
jgi:hypothetical protein